MVSAVSKQNNTKQIKPFLDLYLEFDDSGQLTTKSYDKLAFVFFF
jgi:hypothetical protein